MGCLQDLIVDFIKIINVNYPNAFKTDTKEQTDIVVKSFLMVLSPYPPEILKEGFRRCLEKADYPPKASDIARECKSILNAMKPTAEELWDKFRKALHDADFYINTPQPREYAIGELTKIFEKLPKEIQEYCHSVFEFIRIQKTEDLTVLKAKFIKRIPEIREGMDIKESLSPKLKAMMEERLLTE